jgi:predicted enzyme related to lactoylglutathione lyase
LPGKSLFEYLFAGYILKGQDKAMRYAHTNIVSQDWKRLVDFYVKVFDCTPVPPERDLSGDWLEKAIGLKKPHLRGMHLRLPGFGDGGPTLEVFQYDVMLEKAPFPAANRIGLGHLAFEVEDVAATMRLLLENGGKKLGEIVSQEIQGVGIITFTYATDPEGNILEIQSWKKL